MSLQGFSVSPKDIEVVVHCVTSYGSLDPVMRLIVRLTWGVGLSDVDEVFGGEGSR